MSSLPEFLRDFHRKTGIDPNGWRTWHASALIAVSGIPHSAHAEARRDVFIRHTGMAAELNEPPSERDTGDAVAVPLANEESSCPRLSCPPPVKPMPGCKCASVASARTPFSSPYATIPNS